MNARSMRLKFAATLNDEVLPESTIPDCEIEYVDIGDVEAAAGIVSQTSYLFSDAPSRARRLVRHGDTIVSTVRTYLKAIAPIINPPPNLVVSTGFAVVRPISGRLEPTFSQYLLRDPAFIAEVESRSVGVSYPAINASDLGDIAVPIPPLATQRAIADFLDAETARIDALIAAKENLLTILAEKRRALITEAVTRGLDPSAPMRDSGIPWLGEIPAHWEVVPLRWFARIGSGDFIQSSEVAAEPDEVRTIPVVGGNGVNGFTSVANVSSETVVIGRVGALCGNVHLVEGAAWVTDNALRLRDIRCFMARYLRLVLLEADLNAMASRTAQPLITGTQVMDLRLPLPPSLEQSQIVAKLDEGSAAIERLHMATSITLKLLRERREAVIAAAVTGQLDVGAK